MNLEKTPILFIPGMMCDGRVFEPQLDFCQKNSITAAVVDLTKQSRIEEMAASSLEQAKSLGWNHFIVCGLSLGGIVAMSMTKQPEIAGLILIDTNHLADSPEREKVREAQLEQLENGEFKKLISDVKPFYLNENEGEKAERLWQLFFDMAENCGEHTYRNQTTALYQRESFEDNLKKFTKPVLLLCGEADELCPVNRHQEINQLLKNSSLHIIEKAGHIANLEKPEQVNEIIGVWLEENNF